MILLSAYKFFIFIVSYSGSSQKINQSHDENQSPLRISMSQPVPSSSKKSRKSVFKPIKASTLSDLSSDSDSSSSSDEEENLSENCESSDDFEDEKKIKKRKRLGDEDAEKLMLKLFREDSELYQRILLFEVQ